MITEITLIVCPKDEHDENVLKNKAAEALAKKNVRTRAEDIRLAVVKRSIDARHGSVKLCLRCKAYIGEAPDVQFEKPIPEWKRADGARRVVIVGSGPAGLFGALRLLEDGITPIIVERGEETDARKKTIAKIGTKGSVDGDSNYCFGEGGAGAFSDGKLYTRSTKRGNVGRILSLFRFFGASESILTDAHPHIGTDKLPKIVNAMREKIMSLGGEFHSCTKCVDFLTETENGKKCITGIAVEHTKTKERRTIEADAVLLASGHSANDIYALVARCAPEALEAKTFAAGVRVEHPRELIDAIQFHGKKFHSAEYRLTTQVSGRGVYSFCMCPGGFVVPSATSDDGIVVNGMSTSARNSKWSNAAIVVETRPEDIGQEFIKKAGACPALAGLYWRAHLEHEAKLHAKGQAAPAQRMEDFLTHRKSTSLPSTSFTPGVISSRLDEWLPPHIETRLEKAFSDFNKNMRGFISSDALLIAVETRTSTPVRILRSKETGECTSIERLYPAGEGSGYSGGIVSSAMDGENAAALIAKRFAARQ